MKKLTILLTAIFAMAMTQSAQAGPRIFGGVGIFFGNPDTYYYDGHDNGQHYRNHKDKHWKKHSYFVDDCRYCHHWRDYHYRPHPRGNAYGHYNFRGNQYRGNDHRGNQYRRNEHRGNYYRDGNRGNRGRGNRGQERNDRDRRDRHDRGRRGR